MVQAVLLLYTGIVIASPFHGLLLHNHTGVMLTTCINKMNSVIYCKMFRFLYVWTDAVVEDKWAQAGTHQRGVQQSAKQHSCGRQPSEQGHPAVGAKVLRWLQELLRRTQPHHSGKIAIWISWINWFQLNNLPTRIIPQP